MLLEFSFMMERFLRLVEKSSFLTDAKSSLQVLNLHLLIITHKEFSTILFIAIKQIVREVIKL